jgi:hypothetical protein
MRRSLPTTPRRNSPTCYRPVDMFVVPTISFRLLYGLLILRQSRRELLWREDGRKHSPIHPCRSKKLITKAITLSGD